MSSFIVRLRNGLIACCIVGCGLEAHSECGYRVTLLNDYPDAPNIESIDAIRYVELKEAICYGWPVNYAVNLLGEDGRVYVRAEGASVRGFSEIQRSLPWKLLDGEQVDATNWNACIWTLILVGTLSFSMSSLAVGLKSKKFSMLHMILIMTFCVVLLRVSNTEILGICHFPIAYGVACCLVELTRGLLLICYRFRPRTNHE